MSEYAYVKLGSWTETWHLSFVNELTLCGYRAKMGTQWWVRRWFKTSKEPREPLCKRCIKCREARG